MYVADQWQDILGDKVGAMITELQDTGHDRGPKLSSVRPSHNLNTGAKDYYAVFPLPYDKNSSSFDKAYAEFVDRFNKAEKMDITWKSTGNEDCVMIRSTDFDQLMKAVFEVQVNPLIEQVNKKTGSSYETVNWKKIKEDDERGSIPDTQVSSVDRGLLIERDGEGQGTGRPV